MSGPSGAEAHLAAIDAAVTAGAQRIVYTSHVATGAPLMSYFTAARRGDFAATDPTLPDLLGSAPTSVHDALAPEVGGGAAGRISD